MNIIVVPIVKACEKEMKIATDADGLSVTISLLFGIDDGPLVGLTLGLGDGYIDSIKLGKLDGLEAGRLLGLPEEVSLGLFEGGSLGWFEDNLLGLFDDK